MKIKELKSEINVSQNQLNAELQYHQTSLPYLSQMHTSLKECDDETQHLRDETQHLRERIDECTKTIKILQAQNYRMKKENERFQEILEKNNEQNDWLKKQNDELLAETEKYEREINLLRDEVSVMNEVINSDTMRSLVSGSNDLSNRSISANPKLYDSNDAAPILHLKQSTMIQFHTLQSLFSVSNGGNSVSSVLTFANHDTRSSDVFSADTELPIIEDEDYMTKCEQLEMENDKLKKALDAMRTLNKAQNSDADEVDEMDHDVAWSKLLDDSVSDVLKEPDSDIIARCKLLKYEIQIRRECVNESFQEYTQLN